MNNTTGESVALPVFKCGKGEPVLLIHGIISDAGFFDGLRALLSLRYTVVSYDRRGYGSDTYGRNGDYSPAAQAEDAAQIIRREIGCPVWIYGHSAGGLIAVELSLRYPELVKGLILLEPSLALDEESIRSLNQWNAELNSYVAEKHIKKALPAFSRVTGQSDSGTNGATMAEIRRTYKNLENFMYGELNCIQRYYPGIDRLKTISCPVYVVITEDGTDTVFGVSSAAGARILGWELCRIPGGHNTVKDKPRATADLIMDLMG